MGIEVVHWGTGWYVADPVSGLTATGALRQRRFADEALLELLATGGDFTTATTAAATRDLWAEVYHRWQRRAEAKALDPDTGEYYGTCARYGTFIPSAKWAAAYREARSSGDASRVRELARDKSKLHGASHPRRTQQEAPAMSVTIVRTTASCGVLLTELGFTAVCRKCLYTSEVTPAKHVAVQQAEAHDGECPAR